MDDDAAEPELPPLGCGVVDPCPGEGPDVPVEPPADSSARSVLWSVIDTSSASNADL